MVESNEVRVVIDPKSALFVTGSELDFSDDLQQGGCKVTNPNTVVTCSCGDSFAAWRFNSGAYPVRSWRVQGTGYTRGREKFSASLQKPNGLSYPGNKR